MVTPTQNQYQRLHEILDQMTMRGGFTLSVLIDENGFPIAYSGGDENTSEAQSAAIAHIQKWIEQALGQIDMAEPDELALNDTNGCRLVCRSFETSNGRLFLAVQIPNRYQPYRKAMNHTIRSIKSSWSAVGME